MMSRTGRFVTVMFRPLDLTFNSFTLLLLLTSGGPHQLFLQLLLPAYPPVVVISVLLDEILWYLLRSVAVDVAVVVGIIINITHPRIAIPNQPSCRRRRRRRYRCLGLGLVIVLLMLLLLLLKVIIIIIMRVHGQRSELTHCDKVASQKH